MKVCKWTNSGDVVVAGHSRKLLYAPALIVVVPEADVIAAVIDVAYSMGCGQSCILTSND